VNVTKSLSIEKVMIYIHKIPGVGEEILCIVMKNYARKCMFHTLFCRWNL